MGFFTSVETQMASGLLFAQRLAASIVQHHTSTMLHHTIKAQCYALADTSHMEGEGNRGQGTVAIQTQDRDKGWSSHYLKLRVRQAGSMYQLLQNFCSHLQSGSLAAQ